MKIAMVTGSYPPDACGVGDYTARLVKEMQSFGARVTVVTHDGWNLKNTIALARKIHSIKPDIIHIQYPTVGYAGGFAPEMLCMLFSCVVTLHEISWMHVKGKLRLVPFFLRAQYIIVTSSYEREYVLKRFPWLTGRCSVISVGSSIPAGDITKERDIEEIIYFGLIHPQKGLEEVLQFASLIKQSSLSLRILIVCKVHPVYRQYFETMHEQSKLLPIQWRIGLSEDAVADLLSRARLSYMPFPGGASERRTSLLALLANGVVTVTTAGKHTPPKLKDAVILAQNPEDALLQIRNIMGDRTCQAHLSKKGMAYARNFTWDVIAKKNFDVYNTILSRKTK